MDMDQRILFYCTGDETQGPGTAARIRRCISLARYLKCHRGAIVSFLVSDGLTETSEVHGAGFSVQILEKDEDQSGSLDHSLNLFRPDVCVFDCPDIDESLLSICRRYDVVIVCLDHLGAGLRDADLVINPTLDHENAYYRGLEYAVFPDEASRTMPVLRRDGVTILIYCDEDEYVRLGELVLRKASEIAGVRCFFLVTESGFSRRRLHVYENPGEPPTTASENTPNPSDLLDQGSIVISSDESVLLEAMHRGIPSMIIPKYDYQVALANRYERLGGTISARIVRDGVETQFHEALTRLLDIKVQHGLSTCGKRIAAENGLGPVAGIIGICQLLEWDTAFFGFGIATLNVSRLTEPIVKYAVRACEHWHVDCLYYLADCHHAQSVHLAEKHGFHFVDIRLTFEYLTDDSSLPERDQSGTVSVRPHIPEDVPFLKSIASESYVDSRYYFDEHFPRERCKAFYTEWIEKSCYGYADKVLVAELDGRPVGYITCQLCSKHLGAIELVGVDRDARGNSVGKALVHGALSWFASRGMEVVEVVTQGRNYAAQRLYERCGFVTKMTQLWYHKWFRKEM